VLVSTPVLTDRCDGRALRRCEGRTLVLIQGSGDPPRLVRVVLMLRSLRSMRCIGFAIFLDRFTG
jgi:hypothetical protein